jgi:hypothetical protein
MLESKIKLLSTFCHRLGLGQEATFSTHCWSTLRHLQQENESWEWDQWLSLKWRTNKWQFKAYQHVYCHCKSNKQCYRAACWLVPHKTQCNLSSWRQKTVQNICTEPEEAELLFSCYTTQLYSRGWVDPFPDPLLLRKSGSAGNWTRTSGSVARNYDH